MTSSFSSGGDNTHRISEVIVSGNQFLSNCSEANIRVRDSSNLKIINNICDGGENGIKLGRNTTIKVRGDIDVSGNTLRNFNTFGVQIETADNINFSLINNKMYGGFRGFFSNVNINPGGESSLQIIGNYVDGTSGEGIFLSNSGIEGVIVSNNVAANCTNNGFQVGSTNGIFTGNVSRNCTSGQAWSGTGNINDNNQNF